jgi:hypothetical protein
MGLFFWKEAGKVGAAAYTGRDAARQGVSQRITSRRAEPALNAATRPRREAHFVERVRRPALRHFRRPILARVFLSDAHEPRGRPTQLTGQDVRPHPTKKQRRNYHVAQDRLRPRYHCHRHRAAAVPASAHWKGHGFWSGGLGFGSVVVIEESCYRLWRGVLVNVCR